AFTEYELVQSTARLAAMNMMLHGIGSDKSVPIVVADALAADPGERFDVVLANPPFGKKSSTMITGAEGKVSLDIFWLKDDALADSDNLPPPDVIAQEIVDDLEAALEQFRLIAADLQPADSAG
ncbi:MAG: N-6 DNA methylase, partial [Rhodoferax sp.]|nr:N-6 DNA methylase [Rhodoferax sp.]